MKQHEENKLCDALIQWFQDQGIGPTDAVPIMAKAIIVAVVCLVRDNEGADPKKAMDDGIERAFGMIQRTLDEIARKGGKLQ